MPSTGSLNGAARGAQRAPAGGGRKGPRQADVARYQRTQTRERVIASLLMCPGGKSGRSER